MHDFNERYWTNAPDAQHSDMFQCGSDQIVAGTRFHVIERNFCGDSTNLNSHFGIWQDTTMAGDTNIVIRGNVGYNLGSTGIGAVSTKSVMSYNNTFWSVNNNGNNNPLQWYKKSFSTDWPSNAVVANTILSDCPFGSGGSAISILPGVNYISTHNIGFHEGSDPSFISTSDPLFISTTGRNFRLQSGSAAIGGGTYLVWITSSSGSGTSFTVVNAQLLCDGFGIVDGDTVRIGATTTKITSISGNSVKVANSVTWTKLQPVYWGNDPQADIGAFPYASQALKAANLYEDGSNYTVLPTGDARGVWFYVDGIPTTWVSIAPYTATITNGIVTAKAYALYAQTNPVVVATDMHTTLHIQRRGRPDF